MLLTRGTVSDIINAALDANIPITDPDFFTYPDNPKKVLMAYFQSKANVTVPNVVDAHFARKGFSKRLVKQIKAYLPFTVAVRNIRAYNKTQLENLSNEELRFVRIDLRWRLT